MVRFSLRKLIQTCWNQSSFLARRCLIYSQSKVPYLTLNNKTPDLTKPTGPSDVVSTVYWLNSNLCRSWSNCFLGAVWSGSTWIAAAYLWKFRVNMMSWDWFSNFYIDCLCGFMALLVCLWCVPYVLWILLHLNSLPYLRTYLNMSLSLPVNLSKNCWRSGRQ